MKTRSDVVGVVLLLVVLLLLPLVLPVWVTGTAVYATIYAIAAVGLSLLMGLAGQVSLGHAAFFAVGAYTQGILVTRTAVPGLLSAVIAVALAMLAALLVGLPLLRLRGHYLALATLGLGIILTVVAIETPFLGATSGIFGIDKPEFGGRRYDSPVEYLWLLTPVVVLAIVGARNLVQSRVGRALGAVNDSEVAAETLGVDTFRLRLQVFVLSAGYAGVAGVFFAHWLAVVNPNAANFALSVEFLLMAVLGGLGTVWGAVVGGFAVEFLDEGLREVVPLVVPGATGEVQLIGFGIVLTLVMIFLPGGLHQLFRTLTRRWAPVPAAVEGTAAGLGDGPLLAREGRPEPGTVLLSVRGLTKHYGGVTAVDGVDLDVAAGEIVALIGPNGAGKTTCFNMVSGVVEPSAGTVEVAGTRIDGRKPHVFAAARATRTFQNLQVFGSATVLGNVMVGRHLRSRVGLLRGMLGFAARREEREIVAAAREVIDMVGLTADADRPAADLPFGRQRLMEVARALAVEPDLLLLDEPMAGLSGAERRDLARLLRRLRAGGMGIVLVEHDVEAVLALADRVAVLDDGVRIALGTPQEVRDDPAVVAAYLGVDDDDPEAERAAQALAEVTHDER
ncbi:branched-chain amino acid ABC transporter ATP-binding protein/permease [Pseudonocardia humida]|uniref:Branched-chain amino acid ABC transporter ATP-binding protein/permease n=1 Tax=Pseudonocardia humida TaxID=2800819 RepID=A0ABT1AB68_9PSEU|nr:branched-chain amino acid ABC transporter ATP-binding protein/permease [Pseudonocardia humida]MCO1660183.1 branched-chain amino acid ABC transporter ATP-binding protein/permease [Pseudonocardia humida]